MKGFTLRTAIVAAALAFGGTAAHAEKIQVTDVVGRTVTVEAPAQRVVVTFNYEEYAAIVGPGAFDKVVGFTKTAWYDWRRSVWDKYVAAVPRIAQIQDVGLAYDGTFSVEKVIAGKAQVMMVPKWAFASLGPQVAQL